VTEGGLVPLGFMRPGDTGTLVEIRGLRHHIHEDPSEHAGPHKQYRRAHMYHADRGHRLEHRLQHMGLIPGQTVTVVQNSVTGPVIVAVNDTRLGLARGVAGRIMVRPLGAPESAAG
jgi:Fe2+ transport system protein FeoA